LAKIDLKNAILRLWDGTIPTLTTTNTGGDDGKLLLTALSKHHGSATPSITLVDPGSDGSIAVVVVGVDVTVTLAYATGAVTTTATLLEAALDGDADAVALFTASQVGAGSVLVEAQAITRLTGHNSLEIKVGDGNLTHSEKKTREFSLDRGSLDTVRDADEEPMDVSFDFMWEFLTSANGASVPTIEEVLKNLAPADTWVTTADDTCQPFCVDLEIVNAPACSAIDDEQSLFEEFYYEGLDHDTKEASVACSGRCNRLTASHVRFDSAILPL